MPLSEKSLLIMQVRGNTSTFAAMSIVVRHLSKNYGTQAALDDISFSVRKGELAGFLGPNGAGKSTTMKIITGFMDGTSGTVEVLGHNTATDPGWTKKQIGYLPEHNPLYTDLFVHEFLEFAGHLYGLKGKHLRARVKTMTELCGLTREQNKKIQALSRGYRQRVGIAQALLHDPPVLILDEPTSGLDPNQLVEIRQLIRAVSSDKTVLFSTHIMQEAEALCDRVIVINAGKIVADDTISDLMKKTGEVVFTAEFSTPVDASVFRNLSGVQSVRASDNSGQASLKIQLISSGEDIRPDVFKKVSELRLPLVSLHREEQSMEMVFRSLTQPDKATSE
jgi:ABC-2 type transport system ATP-binding protein